jgi:hypothetical protein
LRTQEVAAAQERLQETQQRYAALKSSGDLTATAEPVQQGDVT